MSEKMTLAVTVLLAAIASAILTAVMFSRRPPVASLQSIPEPVPVLQQLPPPREQGASFNPPELIPRLEALELEVARLRQDRAARNPAERTRDEAPPAAKPEVSRARALDAALGLDERIAGLQALRTDAPERRDADVVRAVATLLDGCEKSMVREEILRQMKGVSLVEMREPLLKWLADPDDARVRRQAAENLAAMREDPVARMALERAAAEDADEQVRLQAHKSLAGR